MTKETFELIRALEGTTCACGAEKKSKSSLCRECYKSLGRIQQMALYRHVGSGYEAAYAKALETLKGAGRVKPEELDLRG